MTRIVCISDTHGYHRNLSLPSGDILIHAGDFTYFGRDRHQVDDFALWIAKQAFQHVIVIAGNHEFMFDPARGGASFGAIGHPEARSLGHSYLLEMWSTLGAHHCHYLENSGVEIQGINVYGAPEQPAFADMAFNVESSEMLWRNWAKIPANVNVLVTHSPPKGILDRVVSRDGRVLQEDLGCLQLMHRVRGLKSLKLHVFGHIHESYGTQEVAGVTFVNASICDDFHKPRNKPLVVDV